MLGILVMLGFGMSVASGACINRQLFLLQVYIDHVTESAVYYFGEM